MNIDQKLLDVVTIITLIVTIITLIVAIWQGFLAREQLKKRPNIVISYINNGWFIQNIGNDTLENSTFFIKNIGYSNTCILDFSDFGNGYGIDIFNEKVKRSNNNYPYFLPSISPNQSICIDNLLCGEVFIYGGIVGKRTGFNEAYEIYNQYEKDYEKNGGFGNEDISLKEIDNINETMNKNRFFKEQLNEAYLSTIVCIYIDIIGKNYNKKDIGGYRFKNTDS